MKAEAGRMQEAPDDGAVPEEPVKKPPPPAALSDIKVYFKLDPSLTRGIYMGDRWVSPPTYTSIQAGNEAVVEVRAQGLDAGGYRRIIDPKWTPSDLDMVTVSPDQGNAVTITVRSSGESTLSVASLGYSRELRIRAKLVENAIRVDITQ